MLVKDAMSQRLIRVAPEENTSVAARLLAHHNIGALPVCSKDGKLRGMVTDRDIVLRCVAAQDDPQTTKISDIMTRRVISVPAEATLNTAAELMAREQVRRLPVEQNGKLVGMLSLADCSRVQDFSFETAAALSGISSNLTSK